DSNGDLFLDLGVAIMGEVTIEVYVNGSYAEYLAPYNSVTISLFEGDEVVINVYAEGYATLYAEWLGAGNVGGGDVNYETEIAVGNNTLYFSAEEIAADAASREAYIDVEGNYSFNSGTLFVSSVVDAFGNTISKNEDYTITLTPGYYTINFSMLSMFGVEADVAQELIVEASESEGGEEGDGEESLESMFAGFYTVDGYSVYIYNDNGVYIFNAYLFDADVNIDNYYTFVAYDNYDGSYAIYLEYYQHEAETGYDELELLDKSFTATYNGESWVITRDRAYGELESMLVGTYTFDEFEVEIYEEDSIYVFNVYSFDFSIDNYYGMVAVEQADGSVYIYIYYSENTNETGYDEFGLENEIFVATQDGNGNWSLEILVVDIPEYELGLGYTNSINAEDMVLTFTAQEDGELFLSLEAIIMGPVDIAVYKNGEILGYLYQYDQVTIDLVAGDEIEIVITAEGYSAIYADWTSSAPAAAAALAMGNTSIEASDATYVYTANDSCTLTLSLGATIMGDVVIEVYVNDSFAYSFTTNEFVEVSLFAGDNVTVVVSAAGYGTLNAEISFKNAVTFPL
ncbi:MAG: hypothetical protein J6Q69_05270, partial [Clostridia bacterium]|nr:hypothetical protein [Clostridia bacterium]